MRCDVHMLRHGELQSVLLIHERMVLFVKHVSVELGRLRVVVSTLYLCKEEGILTARVASYWPCENEGGSSVS